MSFNVLQRRKRELLFPRSRPQWGSYNRTMSDSVLSTELLIFASKPDLMVHHHKPQGIFCKKTGLLCPGSMSQQRFQIFVESVGAI